MEFNWGSGDRIFIQNISWQTGVFIYYLLFFILISSAISAAWPGSQATDRLQEGTKIRKTLLVFSPNTT